MNGYELVDRPRYAPYYWRSIEPTAASLIEALAFLPPDTEIEVTTGPEQVDYPTSVTYWPTEKRANL
jgi:hypothetical protein